MAERSPRRVAGLGLVALALVVGCDEPVTPTAPPRCEPREELVVERVLKRGFKALAVGERDAAAEVFRSLLEEEPGHPEAELGLRLATRGSQVVRPKPRAASAGALVIAGEEIAVDLPVNHERFRFEERRAQWELARGAGLAWAPKAQRTWFSARTDGEGAPVATDDPARLREVVDLIVLHDSHTLTARESFARFGDTGASTHFLIDWDGAVYQTLDLAYEANHVNMTPFDRRSVAIDLVNPVDVDDRQPVPPEAGEVGVGRPLSRFVRVQGEEVQAWGYTEPQMASLERLLRALLRTLPQVTAQVPRAAGGASTIPREAIDAADDFAGVVGHLHLFVRATDPGPGFDWERLAGALGR